MAGAVIATLFFARFYKIFPRTQGVIALALVVWLVYTIDRLLDVRKHVQLSHLQRHQFHTHFYKPLIIACALVCTLLAIIIFSLRVPVLHAGLVLAVCVVVYVWVQPHLGFVKEFAVAFFYTCGVLLLPWSLKVNPYLWTDYLIVVPFFITACINLILFSWFEKEADERQKQSSFVTHFGSIVTRRLLRALFAIGIVSSAIVAYSGFYLEATIFVLMILAHVLIFEFHSNFKKEERYRLLGDSIFFFPLIGLV